ncbi:response regulator [uncultured Paludibaculum sp.]|uniref:hybrid sensor histidine kinase/response regulator n=1 Tax=uncultured Paludibaculum sp. TaxID=1765020 RepID=UPI002AAB9833|nr:response regulator [uncultured Paludibaculum sp.]
MSNALDPEVLRGFLEEARSYLPGMDRCLAALLVTPGDQKAAEELHRLSHCVSGASRVIGMGDLGDAARVVETLLDPVVLDEQPLDPTLLDPLTLGVRRMAELLAAIPEPEVQPELSEPQLDRIPADLLAGFLEEADEHLQNTGLQFRELGTRTSDRGPVLREIRRSIHTIKGAAAMVGLETFSRLAHRMEDLLDLLYEGRLEYSPDRHELLVATYDTLSDLVRQRGRVGHLSHVIRELLQVYDLAVADLEEHGAPEPEPAPSAPVEAASLPMPETEIADSSRMVRAPLERLDDLVRLVGELFVNRAGFERHLAAYAREVEELTLSLQRIRRLTSQFDADHLALPSNDRVAPAPANGHYAPEFDALEFDRYTQLHLLSRELTETTNDLATATSQLNQLTGSFDSYLSIQGRLTSEVQDKLVRLRMVPLSLLANRLHRTVRVASQKSGKLADLEVEGMTAELDKSVVEQLAAPLDHLLRNAVDHGIEPPEVRRAAGKPEHGCVRLRATQEGTEVVIRLSDDGAGVDPERIRETAARLGFLSESEAAQATRQQLFALIFEPGFSTSATVSEISGRGVGLDVVKGAVEALKGSVTLESPVGEGATFTVRMPTTLAITKVLFVEDQQETYALPLAAISQVARLEPSQLEQVSHKPVVRLGSSLLPLLYLSDALNLPRAKADLAARQPLLVLRSGNEEFALAVDRISGAREVMVKPLAGIMRRSASVGGATLLGDGSVVLILNPSALSPGFQQTQKVRAGAARVVATQRRPLNVLIVDDSLSVRRVVANLVKNNGWNPLQAKDGLEALEMLQHIDHKPDVILMDIEMPRMDGFELTATLRSQPDYNKTPIVMLTSRAGEKHRNKALSLGATHYLVKPYQEEMLLSILRRSAETGSSTRVA